MRMQRRRLRFVNKNLIYSAAVLLLIGLVYVLQQGSARASSLIDWTAGPPIINNSYRADIGGYATDQPHCTYQKINFRSRYNGIIGTGRLDGCVVQGKYLSLAHTSDGIYVSFGSEKFFYKFYTDNTAILPWQTVLVPESDRIGFVMSMAGAKSIRAYDDFSSRLTLDSETLRYRMTDWSNQLFPADDGTLQNGASINFSNNGRYIVYQSADDWSGMYPGLVRVDLETGEEKQFGYAHYSNFASPLPYHHYAISNDGNTVAGGGISNLAVWSLSQACVKDFVGNSNGAREICPSRVISHEEYGEPEGDSWTGRARVNGVQFNDDASELSFVFTLPYAGGFKYISLSPNGYVSQTPRLDYLALGDSYSSGEGDTERDKRTNEKYYRPFTDVEEVIGYNQPREKCHVSTRSYPYILAQGMGLGNPLNNSSTRWQTVACSGAVIYDVNEKGNENYLGQGKGGNERSKPRLEGYDVDAKKAIALKEFIPGRQKQIEFVNTYKPKVITLTMGGNDVGFSDKLTGCFFSLNTCRLAEAAGRGELSKSIKNRYGDLVSLYKKLYEASGDTAKIYVFGYPKFISSSVDANCGLNTGSLDIHEREAAEFSIEYLNNVIEQAAKSAGVRYVDIENSLQNGRLCDKGQAYMTGASIVGSNERQESFHPNAKGNYQMAMAVWGQLNHVSLLEYDICPGTVQNSCPDETATEESIIIPPYFQVTEPGYEVEYASDMTYGTVAKGDILQATRSSYAFSPGSTVEVTLFSEPTNLGSYMANIDGSLEVNLQVPNTIPVGYHTLAVDGITYSGEPIRYEQIILVQGPNPDDIDDNGIQDREQLCGPFMVVSRVDSDLDGIDDACDPRISERPELYRWRWGYVGRTYANNPEAENQIYIERNVSAGSATGFRGDYDPDGDGWAVVGVSQSEQLGGMSMNNAGSAIGFDVLEGGTSTSPYYPAIYIRQGTKECKAYKPTSLSTVQTNELRTLSIAAISNDKCPQELPSANPPQQPEPKPPVVQSILSNVSKSLKAIKSQVTSLVQAIATAIVVGLQSLRKVLL